MGPDGPIWALMGPPGQVLAGPISDFWSNFARFGLKIGFLTKFIDDSASLFAGEAQKSFYFDQNL